jgi:GNAT superfamily N-acetyltransferase
VSGALAIDPLTPDRADDLVRLFETDSVCRGCWCQFWRMERKDFTAASQDDKRAAFLARIAQGDRPPGLIASDADGPAAWVQITPREDLFRFQRVPTARPAADTPAGTWALSCFFIRKDLRRQGLTSTLATAACTFAISHGATAVEAAARRPGGSMMWGAGFEGFVPALARAGFVEIEDRTPQRVLMRLVPG